MRSHFTDLERIALPSWEGLGEGDPTEMPSPPPNLPHQRAGMACTDGPINVETMNTSAMEYQQPLPEFRDEPFLPEFSRCDILAGLLRTGAKWGSLTYLGDSGTPGR